MKFHLFCLAGCLSASLGAANLIENGAFEDGLGNWKNCTSPRQEIRRGIGRNGSGGMAIRVIPGEKAALPYLRFSASPESGRTYRFSGWIRTEGEVAGKFCIEVTRNGKFFYGAYNAPDVSSGDWKFVEGTFAPRTENTAECRYQMTLIAHGKKPGTVWFDDLAVVEDAPRWHLAQVWPTHNSVNTGGGVIRLANTFSGAMLPSGVTAKYSAELRGTTGKAVVLKAEASGDFLRLAVPPVEPGNYQLHVSLMSGNAGMVAAEKVLPLTVRDKQAPPPESCVIDERGRAIVNGKPFLPVGIYLSEYKEEYIRRIGASGAFNCVMLYPILRMPSLDAVDRYFEVCAGSNLKVLCNIIDLYTRDEAAGLKKSAATPEGADAFAEQIVNRYRKHPALLAWYIDDEGSADKLPELVGRRKSINALDPHHPAWAAYFQTENFPKYLEALDILAYDPYPIVPGGRLLTTDMMAAAAERTGAPIWAVPQIHNAGAYDPVGRKELAVYRSERFREPKEEDMLALCLLEAIRGAKGFIFYNFTDLYRNPDPTELERRWPEVCRVAAEVRDLGPFLLADESGPEVKVLSERGTVRARCFTDGAGNYRLLVAGLDADHNAELILPENFRLQSSRNGLVRELAPGRLRFTGSAISGDIAVLHSRR